MQETPEFLKGLLETEEQVEIPTGVSFGALNLIARWVAEVYYKFASEMDFPEAEYGWNFRDLKSNGYWYYFKDRNKANLAYAETGDRYSPNATWRWFAESSKVLNFMGEDILEAFGDNVHRETAIKTYRSPEYRHELHMISLPAAVAAMANAFGYENPGFDLSELLKPADQILWTDDFQRDLVGNRDVGYVQSILWKRRAELWKALDEPDPSKWQLNGTGTSWDTASKKLNDCLTILHRPWPKPLWGRVIFIPDPRVGATFGERESRLTRPALVKLFSSEVEARAAATEEMGEAGREVPATKSTTAVSGEPPLPPGYEEFHDAWVEAVQGLKGVHGERMPPPPVVAEDLKMLLVSYDDLKAWWPVV